MWRAEALYEDGSRIDRLFEYDPTKTLADQQYELEAWLVERDKEIVWYSVTWETT